MLNRFIFLIFIGCGMPVLEYSLLIRVVIGVLLGADLRRYFRNTDTIVSSCLV